MIRKKLIAGVMTAAMALTMFMGTGVTALADDPASLGGVTGYISKSFVMDENVTTPDATFKFTVTPLTTDVVDAEGEDVTAYVEKDGPQITISDISYETIETGSSSEGVKTIKKTSAIKDQDGSDLTGSDFPHTGVYAYKVTEDITNSTQFTSDKENMIYSNAEYVLFITVTNRANYGGGLQIESIKGVMLKDQDGGDPSLDGKLTTGSGNTQVDFQNIYSKIGGSGDDGEEWENPDTKALKVTKRVTGDLADHDREFKFTLTLYKSATLDMEVEQSEDKQYPVYTVTVPENEGNAEYASNGYKMSFQFDDKTDSISHTFYLKGAGSDGQSVIFDNVPVGTKFTLSENDGTAITNYDTVITGMSDGIAFNTEKTEGMAITDKLVGEGQNYADVENSYDESPITGIVSNNLPFIILMAAAVAGFAAYLIIKRRRFVR